MRAIQHRPVDGLNSSGNNIAQRPADIGVTNEAEPRKIGEMDSFQRFEFLFGREITPNEQWTRDAALTGGAGWRSEKVSCGRKLRNNK